LKVVERLKMASRVGLGVDGMRTVWPGEGLKVMVIRSEVGQQTRSISGSSEKVERYLPCSSVEVARRCVEGRPWLMVDVG
jgi:hypothetical protein